MKTKHLLLLPYASAFLLGLTFVYSSLDFLVIVGFIPTLIYLKSLRKKPRKYAYLNLFFALFIFEAMVMAWMLETSPSRWLPIDQNQANILVVTIWLLTTLLMSSGFVLFAIGCKYLNKYKLPESQWIIVIASAWALSEFARSVIVSIALAGQNSIIGSLWNYGALGYASMNLPIAFASRFVGLFGLGFLVILLNFGVYKLFTKNYKVGLAFVAPSLVFALLGYVVYAQDIRPIDVAAVHLGTNNISEENSVSGDELLQEIGQDKYDLMVFPEYIDPSAGENPATSSTSEFMKEDSAIVGGRKQREAYPSENLLITFNQNGEQVSSQLKWFIVPYGEYLPYIFKSSLKLAGLSELVDNFESKRQVLTGDEQIKPVRYQNFTVGGQVCSGITTPSLYNDSARNGADVLTNSASLAIFATSPQYHHESEAMAKFHAIANSRPYVQSTRAGQTLIMDADGRVTGETMSSKELEIISGSVNTRNRRTVATILGDYTVIFVVLPLVAIFLISKNYLRSTDRTRA